MVSVDMQRVLKTGVALATEKNQDALLHLMITEAVEITNAFAGILYLYNDEQSCLLPTIVRRISGQSEPSDLSPITMSADNACAYSVLLRTSINIPDISACERFDFTSLRCYAAQNGDIVRSVLVVPFINAKNDIIGVLELINAQNENGESIPFSAELEAAISALASQAAVAVTNMLYLDEIKQLFQSFSKVLISAIDELSPYNVNHTRRVAEYSDVFSTYLDRLHAVGRFSEPFPEERRYQLVMSAWMHDIGKVVTPLEVMNKGTRLGNSESGVLTRFDMALATLRIAFLEGSITGTAYEQERETLTCGREFIRRINTSTVISAAEVAEVELLACITYRTLEGGVAPLLTQLDRERLLIQKGTLTDAERAIMQNHVRLTSKMLSNIHFSSDLRDVPRFAQMHHEYLDGSGYPNGLHGGEIPLEARILAVLDIFEALISSDRPYKQAMEPQQAEDVLLTMARNGKLDIEITLLFIECLHSDMCQVE